MLLAALAAAGALATAALVAATAAPPTAAPVDGGTREGAPEDTGGGYGGEGDGDDPPGPGPGPEDFVDIRDVPPAPPGPQPGDAGGADGVYRAECGRNENGLFNSENVIVAPGVPNGAQHTHDYVGNQDINRFTDDVEANNAILAQGDTSCADGDRSMHYWPVLRDITQEGADAGAPGGGLDGNVGRILTPRSAAIEFRGNAVDEVVPMPRFLQAITGNARAATSGGENANAQWTCTGFEDRISTDRYPLCPDGSDVTRIMDFPSCWDGRNTESEDNRSHIVFPDPETGACPGGTRPVPQLRQTLVYEVPEGPAFAVDGFPEEGHAAVTDHSDFINVMPDGLMDKAVACINSGRAC
ncbi:DUF1996 domain-containing protein [Nocardiopsis suaedae]|uniref:DUF1996 domain-containing protein n=1 Tax=Nocardiopsis suaedae TaxID=3018444 RepID=A0ABT4TLX1_9ACTN|nr:DUF1996 domain-containing protein [Nocardiopsis suaedae]MDA2805234.1 DUF1996 domain-containing protein [Nocardiopsis suaedae]